MFTETKLLYAEKQLSYPWPKMRKRFSKPRATSARIGRKGTLSPFSYFLTRSHALSFLIVSLMDFTFTIISLYWSGKKSQRTKKTH